MFFDTLRFPMTTGKLVKAISAFSVLLLAVILPVQLWVVFTRVPLLPVKVLVAAALSLAVAALAITVMLAPRAVRLEGGHLVVERLWWSDFKVPVRSLLSAELGPKIELIGDVRRVAGNGGLMGFTGLYHVKNVGLVRCWATQLDTPTVLVRRREGRPLLLGVDHPMELVTALRRELAQNTR